MTRGSLAKEKEIELLESLEPANKKQKVDAVPEVQAEEVQEVVVYKERSASLSASPSPDLNVVIHEKFTCDDGSSDIRILSSDGITFEVHESYLIAASTVFADMINERYDDLPLKLRESSKVLEDILPFCYPKFQTRTWREYLSSKSSIVAINKYKIFRAAEVYCSAIILGLMEYDSIRLDRLVLAFAVASTFNNRHLMGRLAPRFAYGHTHEVYQHLEMNRSMKKVGCIKIKSEDIQTLMDFLLAHDHFWSSLKIQYYGLIVTSVLTCDCGTYIPINSLFRQCSTKALLPFISEVEKLECTYCSEKWLPIFKEMVKESEKAPVYKV